MLGVIENKFVIGRDEFFPFSAEIHYFRVEKRYWSICFERIRRAGFRIISTYVPWNLHEERPGNFDFRGVTGSQKDLIVFLELAREFGFKVILKPGPWIKAEWSNGGLPKYLFQDEAIVARDFKSELVMAKNGPGIVENYQPSYLHPKYIGHVKRYLGGLVEVIQNYIFPKGPVFIIQLDEELSFGGNLGAFDADYNNFIITEYYFQFLEEKYKDPSKLPACYGKKLKSFNVVEPPIAIDAKSPVDMVRYFDWIEFKGTILSKYIITIRERLEALGVGCLFSLNLPWTDDFSLPANLDSFGHDKMVIGMQVPDSVDYCRLGRNLRYLTGKTGFCWSSQLYGGRPTETSVPVAHAEKQSWQVGARYHKYHMICSLAAGLKGMNHYMFVGRDHWQGSPLGHDGTVNENYEIIRKSNAALEAIDINTAKSVSKIGIAYYRNYLVQHHLMLQQQFPYVVDLVSQTLNPLGQDLMNLKYDYSVVDIESQDSLAEKDLYFIPVAEYMSQTAQKQILEAVKKGKNVVLFGLMPKFDEKFENCKILSKGLGLSTNYDWAPANIVWEKANIKSIRYGFIASTGSSKVLAKSGTKPVGVCKKVGSGNVYLFTFDVSPKFDPSKFELLRSVFEALKIDSPVSTSDPQVDLIAQVNEKGIILYLINTDTTFATPDSTFAKKVVLSIDIAELGVKMAKVKMIDILDEQTFTFTAKELKEGIVFPVRFHEARIFFIPKK